MKLFKFTSYRNRRAGKFSNSSWKSLLHIQFRNQTNATESQIVSVIGSGPAGFGIAQYLLKNHDKLQVKMIEKCPVPYGLVRYGVSPDHQDVKNCIHGYEKLAENARFSYYGGVEVGRTLSLEEISRFSDSIVLCTGAQKQLRLGVSGEAFQNVFSANEFVGWYNGTNEHEMILPDLSGETAVIVGVGNVALDCARMLLKPWECLANTDVTHHSLQALKNSKIKKVILVGRRGPLQMACTRRELAEITELTDVRTETDQACFTKEVLSALKVKDLKLRKTQRLVKHLIEATKDVDCNKTALKSFKVKLLHSPTEINGDNGKVGSIVLQKNIMSGEDAFDPIITATNETEEVECSLVISAIGYGNETFDPSVPICNGYIPNKKGRIDHDLPLYACGWCKTGPRGVLGDTLNDCLVTGKTLLHDLNSCGGGSRKNENGVTIEDLLIQKSLKWFSWEHWKEIDKYEVEMGLKLGRVREKVVSHEAMANIVFW